MGTIDLIIRDIVHRHWNTQHGCQCNEISTHMSIHSYAVVGKLTNSLFSEMKREDNGYEWATIGLLCQIIGEIIRSETIYSAAVVNHKQVLKLKQALSLIREKYFEPLRLADLAAAAEMTPKYFCRAFAGMIGRTPVDYLIYYRVERAGEKLMLTHDSITDIAVSCGFNDMSYFSKVFKRYKGSSPTQYRSLMAKGVWEVD